MITSSRTLSSPHGSESTEASSSMRWTLMKHERCLVRFSTTRPDYLIPSALHPVTAGVYHACSQQLEALVPLIPSSDTPALDHSYAKLPALRPHAFFTSAAAGQRLCMVDLILVQQQCAAAWCPASKHYMSLVLSLPTCTCMSRTAAQRPALCSFCT